MTPITSLADSRQADAPFDRHWVAVARSSDLDAKGTFQTCTIGSEPLIVIRNGTGDIRAHLNVCRHRGSQILEGCGKVKSLMCPYHGWLYSLDGELRGAPEMKYTEGFDKSEFPLVSFRAVEWAGFVLVSIAPGEEAHVSLGLDRAEIEALQRGTTAERWSETVDAEWSHLLASIALEYAGGWAAGPESSVMIGETAGDDVVSARLLRPNLLLIRHRAGWTAVSVSPASDGLAHVIGHLIVEGSAPGADVDLTLAPLKRRAVTPATASASELALALSDWVGTHAGKSQ